MTDSSFFSPLATPHSSLPLRFMHANRIGTTAFVTDYSGKVAQDELHYPWGRSWKTSGTLEEERYASLHHRDSETQLDPTH